jgi:predicted Zn-dependent protease
MRWALRRLIRLTVSIIVVMGILFHAEHRVFAVVSPPVVENFDQPASVVAIAKAAANSVKIDDANPSSGDGIDDVITLPAPGVHPLPDFLANWQEPTDQGDYFEAIAPTILGYLVWPRFPITVFIEPVPEPSETVPSSNPEIHAQWHDAVMQAVNDWSVYIPLEFVYEEEGADIAIWAIAPPLDVEFDESGLLLGRARSAETRYEFYRSEQDNGTSILLPRYSITIKPGQPVSHLRATARHELGHALGLWGHSPSPTDALYFSQVQTPPDISSRDITTLKRVYQQPTRLGWPLPEPSSNP